MFKIKGKVDQVNSFLTSKKHFIYHQKEELFIDFLPIKLNPLIFFLSKNESRLWLKDRAWKTYYIEMCDMEVTEVTYNIGVNSVSKDIVKILENDVSLIIDSENGSILCELKEKISLQSYLKFSDFLFGFTKENLVYKVPLLTGKFEWEEDLSSYGKIRKILGVAGDNLWISCMSADENRYTKAHLIALDVHTGRLKHHLGEGLPLHDFHIQLLEDRQCIVSYWGKISSHQQSESPFVEIDALTGTVLRNTFSMSLYDANLKLGAWQYQAGKIYFDAAFDTINSTHIGLMDFDTLDVEWFDEVKDRKAGLRNLQVSEDKIYIMDIGNQLFVYEKEK